MAQPSLTVAAASRPHPNETANGDAWAVDWHDGACRVALIDGLGHGPEAAAAARAACDALAARPHLAPVAALEYLHPLLRGTRGAAISIAQVDSAAVQLTFAGVGNVEARLIQDGAEQRLMIYRGIVGTTLPHARAVTLPLAGDWLLLLYTDGIKSRVELPHGPVRDLQAAADDLLAHWARPTDDATILLVAPRRRPRR